MLIDRFAGPGPVVIGLDDTIERRWGAKIKARGIYRDPVRSSHGHFVKASGLRWLSAMLLVPVPWSGRIWSLPFLTILVPSERSAAERGVKHKTLIDGARQVILQIVRWLPDRRIVVVADSGFSAIDLLAAVRTRVCMVTRLRLDARLFAPATPRKSGTMGRPRRTGERLPTLAKRLADPQTIWQALIVPAWYGGTERLVEVATGVAVWSHPGRPPLATPACFAGRGPWPAPPVVPLRWLLVRDPAGIFKPRPFCAPIRRLAWRTSFPGSSDAGPSRSPLPRSAVIWASKPSGNGRTGPSLAPRRCCSGSTLSWRSGPTISIAPRPWSCARPVGTAKPN